MTAAGTLFKAPQSTFLIYCFMFQFWKNIVGVTEMDALITARAFFDACDYGNVWSECKKYCYYDATF